MCSESNIYRGLLTWEGPAHEAIGPEGVGAVVRGAPNPLAWECPPQTQDSARRHAQSHHQEQEDLQQRNAVRPKHKVAVYFFDM